MLWGKIFENYKLPELKIRNNYKIKMKRNLGPDRHSPTYASSYSTPIPTTDDMIELRFYNKSLVANKPDDLNDDNNNNNNNHLRRILTML